MGTTVESGEIHKKLKPCQQFRGIAVNFFCFLALKIILLESYIFGCFRW
jgi:hypothetical protein